MDALLNNEQILAALLAQHGITHVVFSVGAEKSPLKAAIKSCGQYQIFDAVDERNASYFALGLAMELQKPVAVVCSSEMAATNFLPAAAEAYYQNFPLLMISERTAGQKSGAEIADAMRTLTKTTVSLSLICNAAIERNAIVKTNEALRALTLYGKAPVFLSYQADSAKTAATAVPAIHCVCSHQEPLVWKQKAEALLNASGCALILEAGVSASNVLLSAFASTFNCTILESATSSIKYADSVSLETALKDDAFVCPEYVITLSARCTNRASALLDRHPSASAKHWHVDLSGSYYDVFGKLDMVFAAYADEFLSAMLENAPQKAADGHCPQPAVSAAEQRQSSASHMVNCFAKCAENALVQNSCEEVDLSEIQWSNTVELHSTVDSGNTIGCLPMFLGMARVSDKPCYLLIDDVAFYNDVNALVLRDIATFVRIMVLNTGKADAVAYQTGLAADSANRLQSWACGVGFNYIGASDKTRAENNLAAFMSPTSDAPILMEVALPAGGTK